MQAFPARWELYQIITTVDATTFEVYSNNIGPQMFEHITTADMVVFNRCTDALKEMLYKKNIKAMNPRAAIYLDDLNGNSEDYSRNMPLPFDIDADIIDIKPEDYGLWYIDATGEPEKYDGKTVRFLAQVYRGKDVPAGSFVPGRFGMVCCADDVTFLGFICRYDRAEELGVRDWGHGHGVRDGRDAAAVPRRRPGAPRHRGRSGRKGEGRYRLLQLKDKRTPCMTFFSPCRGFLRKAIPHN